MWPDGELDYETLMIESKKVFVHTVFVMGVAEGLALSCGVKYVDCQETDRGSDGLISPGPRQVDRQAGRFEPGFAVRVELQARGPDRQRWNVTPCRSAQTAHRHQRGRQTLAHHLYGNASSAATTMM